MGFTGFLLRIAPGKRLGRAKRTERRLSTRDGRANKISVPFFVFAFFVCVFFCCVALFCFTFSLCSTFLSLVSSFFFVRRKPDFLLLSGAVPMLLLLLF